MPLTSLQRSIFAVLAENRRQRGYIAGGTAINRGDQSPRFSQDIDVFHDTAESVALSAQADQELLAKNGFRVSVLLSTATFQRALIGKDDQTVKLDWAFDSAFRFYPLEPDPEFGLTLSLVDLATNKILAMATRDEPRDLIDALYLHRNFLGLGAIVWAACGKDEGWTPDLLVENLVRFSRLRQDDLDQVHTAAPLDPVAIKKDWLATLQDARELIENLPPEHRGCLYVSADGKPVQPDPANLAGHGLHFGSVGGAWPQLLEQTPELPHSLAQRRDEDLKRYYREPIEGRRQDQNE